MKIALLIYKGCVSSGVFAFAELLHTANKRAGDEKFNVHWCSVDGQPVGITAGGGSPVTDIKPDQALHKGIYDAVLVPGFWTTGSDNIATQIKSFKVIHEALAALPQQTKVLGYCTSVILLACSGLLDRRSATTTWWLSNFIHDTFPTVNWNLTQTCIYDNSTVTASGLNGYLPIAQSLIEEVYGENVLRDIIDLMVIPKPEKAAPVFNAVKLITLDQSLLRSICYWVESTPASKLNIRTLALELHKAERTLARKVNKATGFSLANFMRLLKMNQASELLIYTNRPIKVISHELGFDDDASFRRSFKKVSTYTPKAYRDTFQR